MWHTYIYIAVLLQGAYCNPVKTKADLKHCNIVIKRFHEPVTILEVQWGSTIHLVCDASCNQAGAQPGLIWTYKDRNKNHQIKIENLFRSEKFETYPIYFHRKNELIIRNFGENEETTFTCRGSIGTKRQKAEVVLRGTDCLLKYSFRCQVNQKCIDRSDLCNHRNDCPNGEDEKDCGHYVGMSTTVSQTTSHEVEVETKQPSTENDYVDMSTSVSQKTSREIDVETKQPSTETLSIICAEGKKACKDFSKCINDEQLCNGVQDCSDGGDEIDCGPGKNIDYSRPLSKSRLSGTNGQAKQTWDEDDYMDTTTALTKMKSSAIDKESEETSREKKEKISMVDTGKITVRYSILDSVNDVAKTTVELTDSTTPFNYEDYSNTP